MEIKTLGILIVLSVIFIISGAYLASYVEIGTETLYGYPIPTVTNPYHLLGSILLLVGVIMLGISAVLLVGTLLIREAKTPPSTRRR